MNQINVLLASAGRRRYLVNWFREALTELGVDGKIVVADADPHGASRGEADVYETALRLSSAHYTDWLLEILQRHQISLTISLNDFELSYWATQLPRRSAQFDSLIRLTASKQRAIEDKMMMPGLLAPHGILVPPTWQASQLPQHGTLADRTYVVKARFGSGSRGLGIVDRSHLDEELRFAHREVTHADGRPASDPIEARELTIVQQQVVGREYGLDVIADLDGRYRGVLARQKLAMRHGETDKAVSVDPGPFVDLARSITAAVGHRGLIDVDVIVDDDTNFWVIDINPRFGGGYPFSHLAGAHVPKAYVAWALGWDADESWLASTPGITSAKYLDAAIVGT